MVAQLWPPCCTVCIVASEYLLGQVRMLQLVVSLPDPAHTYTLPCKKLAKNSSHKSVIRNPFLAVINAESALVIAQDNCPVSPGPIQAIFGPVPPCPAPVQGQIVPPVETLVEGLIAMHPKVHGKPTYRSFVATNGLPGGIGCCSEGLVPLCTKEVSLLERFGE